MTCGIYAIINKHTGKMYIGQSVNIETRFKQHCYRNSSNSYIDKEIDRLGRDAFDFKIIHQCSENELDLEEKKFIKLYGTLKQGYNLTWGGKSGPMHSQKVKEKMSKTRTTTGFLNVHKRCCPTTFQGFIWSYKSMNKGETTLFENCDLNELKQRVTENGLPWKVIDENLALQTEKENEFYVSNLKKTTNTGFFGVSKINHKRVKQGFLWQYNVYAPNGMPSAFGSVSLMKLREKVIRKGLPWGIVNNEKAITTLKECGL